MSRKFLNKCLMSGRILRLCLLTHRTQFALRSSAFICVRLRTSVCVCEPSTIKSNFQQYLSHSTSQKSLNKRRVWTQKFFASRRVRTFNFLCADARKHTWTHARGRMQTHAKFFSCILCPSCYTFRPWVSLPTNPYPMLVAFQDSEIQLALDWLFLKPRPQTYSAQN